MIHFHYKQMTIKGNPISLMSPLSEDNLSNDSRKRNNVDDCGRSGIEEV